MLGLLGALEASTLLTIIICLSILPVLLTVILGITIANYLKLTGAKWWIFMILFYIVSTILLWGITV